MKNQNVKEKIKNLELLSEEQLLNIKGGINLPGSNSKVDKD